MLAMPRWGPRDAAVVRVLKLMAPAALGVSVAQVSLLINTNIASHIYENGRCRGCTSPTD
jgi:putative peptidoglycan lipid II flippase